MSYFGGFFNANPVWQASNSKLHEIRDESGEWKVTPGKRREQVVVNRLRAGRTNVTHKYLMDNDVPDIASICSSCNDAVLTVKHILVDFPAWMNQMKDNISLVRRRGANINELLGTEKNLLSVIGYLKAIKIYRMI